MKHIVYTAAGIGSLLALSACTKGTVTGTITDGITNKPVPELRILAKAESTDWSCQAFEGTTDATGTFVIEGLCADLTYTINPGDESWFLDSGTEVAGGGPVTTSITAWKAPQGSAVYFLTDGELNTQRTFSDVKNATILDSDPPQAVRYPEVRPKTGGWPKLPAGSYLLITGSDNIDTMQILPVYESPEIKFNPDREDLTHFSLGEAWDYIGIKMASETEYEVVESPLDLSKAIDVKVGDRAARFIPADALPEGHYAVLQEKAKRTYLFQVGGAGAPAPAEAPAEGDAPAEGTDG